MPPHHRDVDCPEVSFEYKGNKYIIKNIVLVHFKKLIKSEKYQDSLELHFDEKKVAEVVRDRTFKLHNPLLADKLVIIFMVTHALSLVMGVNQQCEMMLIDGKLYKRATHRDFGKKTKEGLKFHIDGNLVYLLKDCPKVNEDQELFDALAHAAQRGIFDDSLKPKPQIN
jgi:hypothetical protein